jgi:glycosyltransferase involved in cell wall biosynthesis
MSDSAPLVSIITPVYNGAKYLPELIESVRDQDYPNIEHIIIDDGSTDSNATVEALERYPHLRWWSRENHGQYATMNEGMEAARGEIVCFISADDMMTAGAISSAVAELTCHPAYDGIYGLTNYISEDNRPLNIKNSVRYAPLKYFPYFAQIQHSSLYLYKKSLREKGLSLDTKIKFVGDYDWIIRLIGSGLQIGFIDSTLSTIRVHPSQASTVNRMAMMEEQFQVAGHHGYGGIKYLLFLNILRLLNFYDQATFAYQQNGIRGAGRYGESWVRNKLLPYLGYYFRKTMGK